MKKRSWLVLATIMVCFATVFFLLPEKVSAHQTGEVVMGGWNRVAGTYNAKGQIVLNVCTEDYQTRTGTIDYTHVNSNAIDSICKGDAKKTLVIPAGATVELMNTCQIGSNTTIIADGATIIMKGKDKGIFANRPDKLNYKSLENVTIHGGTWKLTDETGSCSVLRFSHGNNVLLDSLTVVSNYESHAIALVAMKNSTVQNCTLQVQGKKNKNSVEEALQIDVATPKTAPVLVKFGTKFVQGQTCKNIKVLNNIIEGSRGVGVNFDGADGNKYRNKFHDNITIMGNTMTGYSAEGCVVYNTIHAVVKNNVIRTYSTRKKKSYSVGLNITIQGKASNKMMKNSKITVENNTIYGVRQGMQVISMTSSKYKNAIVKNNRCYASKKKEALKISNKAVKKIKNTNNKQYKR